MKLARLARLIALAGNLLVACGSSESPRPDGAVMGPACTGAIYDTCTGNDQCTSMICHLYNGSALQVCTQTCSASQPCPNDSTGAAVACNQMGNCKPSVANNCHR